MTKEIALTQNVGSKREGNVGIHFYCEGKKLNSMLHVLVFVTYVRAVKHTVESIPTVLLKLMSTDKSVTVL